MTANHKNVVLISALRLSDDIVVGTVLADSLDEDSGRDGGRVAHLGKKLVANLLSNTDNRSIITVTSESARQGLKWNIVVEMAADAPAVLAFAALMAKVQVPREMNATLPVTPAGKSAASQPTLLTLTKLPWTLSAPGP